jgi:hypothetical protein
MTQEQITELKKICIEQASKYSASFDSLMKNAETIYQYLIKI